MMPIIHMSFQKVYRYDDWLFEWHRNKPFPPEPLKKDCTPRKRAGARFYAMFDEFYMLTIEQQETYRVI